MNDILKLPDNWWRKPTDYEYRGCDGVPRPVVQALVHPNRPEEVLVVYDSGHKYEFDRFSLDGRTGPETPRYIFPKYWRWEEQDDLEYPIVCLGEFEKPPELYQYESYRRSDAFEQPEN